MQWPRRSWVEVRDDENRTPGNSWGSALGQQGNVCPMTTCARQDRVGSLMMPFAHLVGEQFGGSTRLPARSGQPDDEALELRVVRQLAAAFQPDIEFEQPVVDAVEAATAEVLE